MRKLIKNKKSVFLLILLGILAIFSKVLALETAWPPSPLGTSLSDSSTITELIRYLYEWGIGLGGLAAFIALVIAGFLYLTSVGDPGKMSEAKSRIYWALGGLVLLLASWLFLNLINPAFTTLREPAFRFDIVQALAPCDTDTDCPGENCQCYGDPNPGDNDRRGACFCKEEGVEFCNFVEIYEEPNFRGTKHEVRGVTGKDPGGCESFGVRLAFRIGWGGIERGSSLGRMDDGRKDGKCYLYWSDAPSQRADNSERDSCVGAPSMIGDRAASCRCLKCQGILQVFREPACLDMMTQLAPTNKIISLERKLKSVKFVTEP